MKRLEFIYCISIVFMPMSGSVAQDICSLNDYNVLSVFNLHYDLILQLQKLNTGVSKFWRISNITSEKHIFKGKKLSRYQTKHFYQDGFVENDNQSSHPFLDEKKPIFGYIIPINKTEEWAQKQGLSGEDLLEFKETNKKANKHFICLNGFKISNESENDSNINGMENQTMRAYIFNRKKSNVKVSPILNEGLQEFMNKRCVLNQVKIAQNLPSINMTIISFTNWPEFDYDSEEFNNITVVKFVDNSGVISPRVKLLVSNRIMANIIDTWIQYLFKDRFYFVFKYNSYYKYLFCGEKCTLDTKLYWMGLTHVNGSHALFDWDEPQINLTISKLLGCQPSVPEPELNSFCTNSRTFQSIFSLGKDVYFQSSSRFWRFAYNRFTNESNIKLNVGNKYQIRLESELGSMLNEVSFDSGFAVHAFSYTVNSTEWCHPNDGHKCYEQHLETKSYLGVCIFGKGITVSERGTTVSDLIRAFVHTPYGLHRYRNKRMYQGQHKFCNDFWKLSGRFEAITGTDVQNDLSYPTDSQDFDLIYILVNVGTYEGHKKTIKRAFWRKFSQLSNKTLIFETIFEEESHLMNSIFFFGGHLYSSDSQSLGFPKERGFDRNRSDLYTFFNCPFNTTASIVRLYKENVCDNNPRDLAESVFTVGTKHYHQRGKYFYVGHQFIKNFSYDDSVTNLLNDYFDTTHRLTAYTIELLDFDQGQFEVVFHGKSSANFKHLGEFIFALFKYNSSTSYLQPIKRFGVNDSTNITIGLIIPKLKTFGFIDSMGNLITKGRKHNLLVWIQENTVFEKFELMQTQNGQNIFRSSELGFKFSTYTYKQIQFREIVGIYRDLVEQSLRIVAYPKHKMDRMIVYQMNPLNEHSEINTMDKFFEVNDYYSLWCDRSVVTKVLIEIKSKSSSKSTSKTLSTILGILLIILLILSFVVGLYFSRQKENIDLTEDSKVDTMAPNPN